MTSQQCGTCKWFKFSRQREGYCNWYTENKLPFYVYNCIVWDSPTSALKETSGTECKTWERRKR